MTTTTQLNPDILVHDEHLAYIDEQTFARRSWWLNLYIGGGTLERAIERIEKTVEMAEKRNESLALPDGHEKEEEEL